MRREALPAVLTAITERPLGHWLAEVRSPAWRGGLTFADAYRRESRFGTRCAPAQVRWKVEVDFARKTTRERSALLTVESPAHGVEVLSERGLWPWAPGDADAPRWWCETCGSPVKVVEGVSREDREAFGAALTAAYQRAMVLPDGVEMKFVTGVDYARCPTCDNARSTNTPRSLAALVAVASLGAATLRRVAELVRELCAVTRGETGATLVWRVMTREALREHYQRETTTYARLEPHGRYLCKVFAHESFGPAAGHPPWPEASTYARSRTAAAWPALRALAVHEDGETPTGLHLVAADRERVVIAVEAL